MIEGFLSNQNLSDVGCKFREIGVYWALKVQLL